MMSDDCNDSIDDEHDTAACDGGSRSEDADEEDTDLIMLVCSVIEDNRKQQLHVKRAYNTIRELGRDILDDEYDELCRDLECIERLRIQLNQNVNDHFSSQLGESKMDEMQEFVEGRVEKYLSSSLHDEEESISRLSLGSRSYDSRSSAASRASSTNRGGDDEPIQRTTGHSTSVEELALENKRLEKDKRLVSAKEAELAEREQALAKKEKAAKESLRKKTEKAKTRMEAEYRKKMDEVKKLEAEAKKRISQLETNAKAEADRLRLEHERRLALGRTKTSDTQSNNDADDASKNGDDNSSYQRETGARHRSSSRNQSNGGHVPFSGSTMQQMTEEREAEAEKHEQAKLLADEEAQAKLAAEQRLEKERLDRERQRWESDMKQCNDMQQILALAMSDDSTTQPLLAVKTNFLDTLSDILDVISDHQHPERLDRLPSVAIDAISVLRPLVNAYNVVASQQKGEASKMASAFGDGGNATLARLLDCCDTTKRRPSEAEDPVIAAELERVQKAICLYNKDDIEKISQYPSKKVEKFVKLGHPTRNMLMHLFNLIMTHLIIAELKLSDVVAHLPKDVAEALIKSARELARLVNPDSPFISSMIEMTIMAYLNTFAFPGLDTDAWELASQVVLRIFDSLTNVGSSPTQVESHRTLVLPCVHRVQSITVSGVMNDSCGVDYCGDSSRSHRDRRRRAFRLYALNILKRSITRRLPNDFFDDFGGFTRCLLRLSPTNVVLHFLFINDKFFMMDGIDNSEVEKIKSNVLKKQNPNDGERTLLIENDEQINSLKRLLKTLV